jgi:hypothetical protein
MSWIYHKLLTQPPETFQVSMYLRTVTNQTKKLKTLPYEYASTQDHEIYYQS